MMGLSKKLLDIRTGEGVRASLMFSYIFLIIASLMIVKPMRNSLFLVEFGVEKLPFLFVLVALFAVVICWIYSRFTKTLRINHLIISSLLISITCLLVFWFLLYAGYRGGILLYVFYIWVSIFGVLASSQFWLLANFVFNVREAKRLFGFIGAGAIAGGICGGYMTNYLAPKLRTENMIFFCIAFLTLCIILFWLIWRNTVSLRSREKRSVQKRADRRMPSENLLKTILGSRHLSYLTGITGVGVVVATLIDYQFNAVASRVITDTDGLTAFFGFWLSTLNVISLGIQLVLTSRILRYFGIATSLFFLPVGILLGAIAIILSPGLGSAIIIKLSDGSFKHSINKAGMELLSLPVPAKIKAKVKTFIDVFVDNTATGLAGVLLIFLTIEKDLSVSHISVIIIILVILWLYMIHQEKREYINSIRSAIENRTIDLNFQSRNLEDPSIFGSLMKALDGKNDRQILYSLRLLEGAKNRALLERFKRLIGHPSSEVKVQVLDMALQYEKLDLSSEAELLTDSHNHEVRVRAIRYVCEKSDNSLEVLDRYLNHPDYRVRGSAMLCAAAAWRENEQMRSSIDLEKLMDDAMGCIDLTDDIDEKRYIKMNAATFIGESGNPDLFHYLVALLEDEAPDVVRVAVENAGRIGSPELVSYLLGALDKNSLRKHARNALAEYGEDIIETLAAHLQDPLIDVVIRREIPRILALIRSQKSVDILVGNIGLRDLSVRYQVLKALNKLKTLLPSLKISGSLIEERIHSEVKLYYSQLGALYRLRKEAAVQVTMESNREGTQGGSRARRLLMEALTEKLDNNLERIFRLLGLVYTQEDMYNVYLGVTSDKSRLKADSIEFLDNVLSFDLKRTIIPVVESVSIDRIADAAYESFGLTVPTEEHSVRMLLEGDDVWLKVCTLFMVAETRQRKYYPLVVPFTETNDLLVVETSRYYLERVGKQD